MCFRVVVDFEGPLLVCEPLIDYHPKLGACHRFPIDDTYISRAFVCFGGIYGFFVVFGDRGVSKEEEKTRVLIAHGVAKDSLSQIERSAEAAVRSLRPLSN